jgi:hypothetical protein
LTNFCIECGNFILQNGNVGRSSIPNNINPVKCSKYLYWSRGDLSLAIRNISDELSAKVHKKKENSNKIN